MQPRSRAAVPSLATRLPAAQLVQDAHDAALVTTLKVPLAHAAQPRSAVVVPSRTTYWPALQVVVGTQAVAALESWSQVPARQATADAVAPAH